MTTRFLALALLLSACQSPPAPVVTAPLVGADRPSPPPSASAAPAPSPPRRAPPGDRVALYLAGSGPEDLRVHRIEPRGAAPTRLPFTVSATNEGTIHVGRDFPVLSPDGSLLAFGRRGRLYLGRTDGSAPPEAITRFTQGEVRLLLGGFSPDGQTLLFHHGRRIGEDTDPPLPPGFVEGFHLLHVSARKVEPIPTLEGFDTWDSDSRHVIYDHPIAQQRSRLMRGDTRGDPPVTLQETANPWGFGQVEGCGPEITFVLEAQMIRGNPDGSGRRPIGPKGVFAEYQSPRCSPGGAHVLYRHRPGKAPNEPTTIEVAVAGAAAPVTLLRCAGNCPDAGWESDNSVLVLSQGVLHRVGLDGQKTMIASQVVDIVVP